MRFLFFVAVISLASMSSVYAENDSNLSLVTVTGDAEVKVVKDFEGISMEYEVSAVVETKIIKVIS